MQELILNTGSGQSDILVGEGLMDRLKGMSQTFVLLVDENVLKLHPEKFESMVVIPVPTGESNKTMQTVEYLYRELIGLEYDRSILIVGVGGGLVTDIAGYVASTFLRGVRFGFISTTLLGQVDASIGGKNGVNLDGYKNMIGVIRQPEFIWCDYQFLDTLEDRQYISGLAEVIKYGAIKDRKLLEFIEDHMESLLSRDKKVLEEVITKCIQIKADVVQMDERESGERRLLNFGHTVGHAIERNYGLLHGEAISVGMDIAARLSVKMKYFEPEYAAWLRSILQRAGLPVEIKLDPGKIYNTIRKDKKKEGSGIHFIFLKSPGNAFSGEIDLEELKQSLDDLCKHTA